MAGDVPGAPPEPWACTDDVVAGIGRLVRRLHDASAGWVPPPELAWFGRHTAMELPADLADLVGPPELVAHCDVTPQNVVFRDGRPAALVDFDLARPTRRVLDLLTTAMWWVPLQHPADRAPAHADVDVPARFAAAARRVRPAGGGAAPSCSSSPTGPWRRSWLLDAAQRRSTAAAAGPGCGPRASATSIERRRAWIAAERDALALASRRVASAAVTDADALLPELPLPPDAGPPPGRGGAAGPLEPCSTSAPSCRCTRAMTPATPSTPTTRPSGPSSRRWPRPRRPTTPSWRSPPCSATAT